MAIKITGTNMTSQNDKKSWQTIDVYGGYIIRGSAEKNMILINKTNGQITSKRCFNKIDKK